MSLQSFEGAAVYLPDEIAETRVTVENGKIVEIGGPAQGVTVDARGLVLAPAMIDVHGDAFERQLMPRPGTFFPNEVALIDTDRQLAANGIATAYHALTLGWEPGLRDVARGREVMEALHRLAPRLSVEHRFQLRWETFAFDEAADTLRWALDAPLAPAIAFNDHTSMTMRAFDTTIQERAFEHSPDFATASLDDARLRQRTAGHAKRSGMNDDAYLALLRRVWDRRAGVPEAIATVAAMGRAAGAPMLSHDDTRAETRDWFRGLGARVAEFPMVREAAENARAHGDHIVFGAPNAARGGSHIGSLSAADMVETGLCDALASDYYYPALLAAIDRLDRENRADRLYLWTLVSSGPARAMGLVDRGLIAVGQRADLVLVDWPKDQPPAILGTWVAGRAAYRAVTKG